MLQKLVAPVVVSGALLGSLAVGGTAYAATPTPTPATATAGAGSHHGAARAWWKAHRRAIRAEGLAISASTIGVSRQTLVAELRTGTSIAQVAGEHNVSASSVESALTTAADAKVAAAVTAGKLTQTQADTLTARIPARVDAFVTRVHQARA